MTQYVGIDLHRRRSVIVRQTQHGEVLEQVRIDNDPLALAAEIAKAGPDPEVVLEATYGWYWAADVLAACRRDGAPGAPVGREGLGLPAGEERRQGRRGPGRPVAHGPAARGVDRAAGDAGAARAGPPPRQAGRVRSGLKAQVHAVLAKQGVAVPMSDLFGKAGMRLLADAPPRPRLPAAGVSRCWTSSTRFDYEVDFFARLVAEELARPPRLPGDPAPCPGSARCWRRCSSPRSATSPASPTPPALCSWAGLTPRHRESDTTVHRGAITKQGSKLVRWAAVEAVQKLPARSQAALRPRPHRRPPRPQHRQGRRRPPAAHARLLRSARRPPPLPAAAAAPREIRQAVPARARVSVMTPTPGRRGRAFD